MRILTKSETDDLFSDHLAWVEVMLDRTRKITFATRPLERMFGYQVPGDLIGQTVESLIPDDQRGIHSDQHFPAFLANPEPRMMGRRYRLRGVKKDGTVFPVGVLLMPKATNGTRVVVALVFDMTNMEDE